MFEALALLVILGVTEGAGLMLIVPLLDMVGFQLADDGAVGRVAEWTETFFAKVGLQPSLGSLLLIYLAAVGSNAIASRRQANAVSRVRETVAGAIRRRVYDAVSRVSWAAFSRLRTSEVVHAITIEADRVGGATAGVLQLGSQVVLTLVYVAAASALSLSLVGIAVLGAGTLLLVVRSHRAAAHALGLEVAAVSRTLTTTTSDLLAGAKLIRAHGLEGPSGKQFEAQVAEITKQRLGVDAAYADANVGLEVGAALVMAWIVSAAVVLTVSPASLMVLLFLFARIARRTSGLHYRWQSFLFDHAADRSIGDLLKRLEADALAAATGEGACPFVLEDAVRLENVSYAYPGRERPVLQSVSLEIRARQVTVLIGPSGVGKTTVADLVLGLLTPTTGKITVDSRPIRAEGMTLWRDQVAYLPQEPFLLPGTVRQNLEWASPRSSESEPEVERALQLADAWDFVQQLPKGADTPVGERGGQLSGGQRQRLALACALMRRPQLLVLDEPTNALDPESAARVWSAVERLRGTTTVLVISHHPESVSFADRRLELMRLPSADPSSELSEPDEQQVRLPL